jgi:hypothetical protein
MRQSPMITAAQVLSLLRGASTAGMRMLFVRHDTVRNQDEFRVVIIDIDTLFSYIFIYGGDRRPTRVRLVALLAFELTTNKQQYGQQ